jgi:hypothetical protein
LGHVRTDGGNGSAAEHVKLREIAIHEFAELGLVDPSEQAIESRVKTLAGEEKRRPRREAAQSHAIGASSSQAFGGGLAHFQGFCQEQAHKEDKRIEQKRKGKAEKRRDGEIPYYFAPLPDIYVDRFAEYLPASAGIVLWVLWRYAKANMQTWISQATLGRKTGTSINTVKRDLNLLEECKIICRTYASGNDFKGNPIRKKQGYKFRLNPPLAWNLERAKSLKWKGAGRKKDCG